MLKWTVRSPRAWPASGSRQETVSPRDEIVFLGEAGFLGLR